MAYTLAGVFSFLTMLITVIYTNNIITTLFVGTMTALVTHIATEQWIKALKKTESNANC